MAQVSATRRGFLGLFAGATASWQMPGIVTTVGIDVGARQAASSVAIHLVTPRDIKRDLLKNVAAMHRLEAAA